MTPYDEAQDNAQGLLVRYFTGAFFPPIKRHKMVLFCAFFYQFLACIVFHRTIIRNRSCCFVPFLPVLRLRCLPQHNCHAKSTVSPAGPGIIFFSIHWSISSLLSITYFTVFQRTLTMVVSVLLRILFYNILKDSLFSSAGPRFPRILFDSCSLLR